LRLLHESVYCAFMYEATTTKKEPVFDYHLSATIAENIHAVPKACWINSFKAIQTQEQLEKAWYVEGWAVPLNHPMPIEHGWIETEAGIIIDPTFAAIQDEDNPDNYYRYFTGVRYTKAQLQGVDGEKLPHVWTFGGWGGYQYPPYRNAYEQAISFANEKHNA